MYEPKEKIKFDPKGRCLLYYYRPRFYTFTFKYSKYIIPFYYIASKIPGNTLAITYPVITPLLFMLESWLLLRLIKLKSYFRKVISEIYLHRDGETLEIVW